MSNRKEEPKQEFSGELTKGEKWKDIRDIFFLTTVHEDVLVEASSSRGHIIK
jgi:hypothetical protein